MDLQIYILWKINFLFCFICHIEISQMKAPFTENFCYFWKAIKWIGVYWGGLQCLDLCPIKIKDLGAPRTKFILRATLDKGPWAKAQGPNWTKLNLELDPSSH
jgi:hypothetical protein